MVGRHDPSEDRVVDLLLNVEELLGDLEVFGLGDFRLQNPNEMALTAAYVVCEHGEGKAVSVLLKHGDTLKVDFGSPQHRQALRETVE